MEKDLIKKGKIIASKKETSLSRLLSDFLKQIINFEKEIVSFLRAYESKMKKDHPS